VFIICDFCYFLLLARYVPKAPVTLSRLKARPCWSGEVV